MLDFRLVQKRANASAQRYERSHFLQQAMVERLLARMDYIKMQPERILDLGCATGWLSELLKQRYPNADVVGLDFALQRLQVGNGQPMQPLAGDMHALPLTDGCIDLVIANDSLAWVAEVNLALQEILRVVRPGGLMMLTSYGPLSWSRLRELCQQQGFLRQPTALMDMHDLGDALLQAGWTDPVMDSEWLQLHFDSTKQLVQDCHNLGAGALEGGEGLITPRQWQHFWSCYPRNDQGTLLVDVELVHGHAWKPLKTAAGARLNEAGEAVVPLSSIKRQ